MHAVNTVTKEHGSASSRAGRRIRLHRPIDDHLAGEQVEPPHVLLGVLKNREAAATQITRGCVRGHISKRPNGRKSGHISKLPSGRRIVLFTRNVQLTLIICGPQRNCWGLRVHFELQLFFHQV